MLSRPSGQIFFLAALPSSDLAAFQSGSQRQSPASDTLGSQTFALVFILLHFDSVHLQEPSFTIVVFEHFFFFAV